MFKSILSARSVTARIRRGNFLWQQFEAAVGACRADPKRDDRQITPAPYKSAKLGISRAVDSWAQELMVDCPNLLDEFVELRSLTDDANKMAHFPDHAPSCGRPGDRRAILIGLGLNRIGRIKELPDTPDRTSGLLNRDPGIIHLRVPTSAVIGSART